MSGYEPRSQEPSVYDYATTRSSQAQSYAAFAPPSFSPQFSSTQAGEPHALASSHQMPFLGPPFEPRDPGYQSNFTPLIPARSRTSPEVTSSGTFSGRAGEKFRIDHRSRRDYQLQQTTFSLIFGSVTCKATVTAKSQHGEFYVYALTVDIPPPPIDTPETRRIMPLLLDIQDENGVNQELENYGIFEYLTTSSFQPYPQFPAHIESRKRKLGQETTPYVQPLSKRAASQPIQPRHTSSAMSPSMQAPIAGPSQYFDPNIRYALPSGGYDRPAAPQRMYGAPLSHSPTFGYGSGPALQQHKVRSPSAAAQSFYSTVRPSTSPRVPRTPRISSAQAGGSSHTQPTLVRTSILQQGSTASASRGFNPYANYPDGKAELVLQGDLMSMVENWTPEEREARRRLVEFSRSQTGSVVTATFKAVTLEDRTPNGACLSCIWWEERNDYFVTSVDTIGLLESLIAARFTVEEKNRIRRNLEGLKPTTVSKLNHDTESFFRLIMSFPNPKPRNIEKDVKVFYWTQLETALTKIFSKYSASFSSTASHLIPSGQISLGMEASGDQRRTASPRSTTGSTASVSHGSSMTSTALSPNIRGSAGLRQYATAQERGSPALVGTTMSMMNVAPQEYRTSMLGMGQMMPVSGPDYGQYGAHYPAAAQQYHPMGLSSARAGYAMSPYLEGGASSTTPSYAQPLHYYRGEEASEQAGAVVDTKTSFSPRQTTTSG